MSEAVQNTVAVEKQGIKHPWHTDNFEISLSRTRSGSFTIKCSHCNKEKGYEFLVTVNGKNTALCWDCGVSIKRLFFPNKAF